MKKIVFDAKTISLMAILIAVTAALTLAIRIPFAPTRGYISLADVGVIFAGLALGPVAGFVAGGVGTGLADAIGGYPQWMIASLIIHGLQGLAAGLIGYRAALPRMILGFLAGAVIMVGGYFLAAAFVFGYGIGPAVTESLGNTGQAIAGGLIGLPLVAAVRKAYPPINDIGRARAWEEQDPGA
ncbi:MAG: ECF transporter S component [Treponema sp.]|nr:ECF transporter S component [Treponema sp.]